MSIQIGGYSANTVAEVDGTDHRALRTTARPLDDGSLGHYTFGGLSGIIGAGLGASSEILQFRWTSSSAVAVIRKVMFSATVSTTFFSAGVPVQIDICKATGWTAAGTGGSAATTAATLKKKTSMASTSVNEIRTATTAALGAGTKTLEANSLALMVAPGPTAAPGLIFAAGTPLFVADVHAGEHPLVLAQNEGFVIRSIAVPATGTWTFAVQIDWAETTSY